MIKTSNPIHLRKAPHPQYLLPNLAQLQAQIRDIQIEIDILKEMINVLKKDPRIDVNNGHSEHTARPN